MPTCCVPGCKSGYRNDVNSSERHFFCAPSNETLRSAWNRAIPRADRELSAKSKAGSDLVNFEHYRKLHDIEEKEQLKVVPRLTASHVNPKKLEKMNVRLSTQLFSRSVAVGLKFYREQQKPGFEGTEGTESFTRRMNDLFDALNAKFPAEGIRKNSPQLKVIIDFLDMLN
ncbi:hypothetical protein V5799_025417 [Amblyomma americanum]|uniref:THAP-type domain-containing protein n=1 Tax=Amblyomma americanum TaxID=6943 RepID=A0AAQ4E9M4_AMBAM